LKTFHRTLISFLFILTISSCSTNKSLTIKDQWARPGIKGNTSAAYLVIDNPTNSGDKLLSAESDIASFTEIHLSSMQDGKMLMQQQDFVEIPAKGTVLFEPLGLHIMFVDLYNDLSVGDQFELKLIFENNGEKTINVTVKEQ
jgi:copper(I)-binding protein